MAQNNFRNALLAIMVSNKGRIVAFTGSVATAMLAGLVARYGVQLSAETSAMVASIITAATSALIEAWAISQTTAGVKKIQEILQNNTPSEVKQDGVPGVETIHAVKQATK